MGFGEAISSGFSNYVGFSGRAARSEYWFWTLFLFLVYIVAEIIDVALISAGSGIAVVTLLAILALALPSIAVTVRRLHDLDRSGWWILLGFIPLVGGIILLIWYCSKGSDGSNQYGADPLAGHA